MITNELGNIWLLETAALVFGLVVVRGIYAISPLWSDTVKSRVKSTSLTLLAIACFVALMLAVFAASISTDGQDARMRRANHNLIGAIRYSDLIPKEATNAQCFAQFDHDGYALCSYQVPPSKQVNYLQCPASYDLVVLYTVTKCRRAHIP